MNFEQLNQFADAYSTAEDVLLAEINAFTQKNHAEPHMLSGHVQGQLLKMISHMIRPERILEIGTFTGYSALCLAAGLQPNGVLHTIEFRSLLQPLPTIFSKNRLTKAISGYTQVMRWKSYQNWMKTGTLFLLMPINLAI